MDKKQLTQFTPGFTELKVNNSRLMIICLWEPEGTMSSCWCILEPVIILSREEKPPLEGIRKSYVVSCKQLGIFKKNSAFCSVSIYAATLQCKISTQLKQFARYQVKRTANLDFIPYFGVWGHRLPVCSMFIQHSIQRGLWSTWWPWGAQVLCNTTFPNCYRGSRFRQTAPLIWRSILAIQPQQIYTFLIPWFYLKNFLNYVLIKAKIFKILDW